jgi:hypothetical protein
VLALTSSHVKWASPAGGLLPVALCSATRVETAETGVQSNGLQRSNELCHRMGSAGARTSAAQTCAALIWASRDRKQQVEHQKGSSLAFIQIAPLLRHNPNRYV